MKIYVSNVFSTYKNILWKKFTILGKIAFIALLIMIFVAIFAPAIAPHDPFETSIERRFHKPVFFIKYNNSNNSNTNSLKFGYLLGCDETGQDIFSRIIYGTRYTLFISFTARAIALIIGVSIGLISGYYGGWLDWLLMRLVEIFLAFPSLLLALAISVAFGSGFATVIIALSAIGWAETAKIIRSQTLEIKIKEFIMASKAIGASDLRIILKHILPNCLPTITVIFTMGMAYAILAEASLSFLGLGVDPSYPTWGSMISASKEYIWWQPQLSFYPGLCIAFAVTIFNILGDELRDIFDPSPKYHWLS